MTDTEVREALSHFIKKQKGHKSAADALRLSQGYLSDMVSGRRAIPDSVLAAIGLERTVTITRRAKAPVSR